MWVNEEAFPLQADKQSPCTSRVVRLRGTVSPLEGDSKSIEKATLSIISPYCRIRNAYFQIMAGYCQITVGYQTSFCFCQENVPKKVSAWLSVLGEKNGVKGVEG